MAIIATFIQKEAASNPERFKGQGTEMARDKQFSIATDMAAYFCYPASPGSAAPTRTPTPCCVSTLPWHRPQRLRIQGPSNSTDGQAKRSVGKPQPSVRVRKPRFYVELMRSRLVGELCCRLGISRDAVMP